VVDILPDFDPTLVEHWAVAFHSSLVAGRYSIVAAGIQVVAGDNSRAAVAATDLVGSDHTSGAAAAIDCWDRLQAVEQLSSVAEVADHYCLHHSSTSCIRSSKQRTSNIDRGTR